MTRDNLWSIYNKLKPTDQKAVNSLLHRDYIVELVKNRLKTTFSMHDDKIMKLSSHDVNVLVNILVNTRQPISTIEKFINNESKLSKIPGNVMKKTSASTIARDLFFFTPTIGNNPTGPGEFLLAFYFTNIAKRVESGDLEINGRKYELKSSTSSTTGGGKLNSSKLNIYGSPDSVMRLLVQQFGVNKNSNIFNPNAKNMKLLSKTDYDLVFVSETIFKGLYLNITASDFNHITAQYLSAIDRGSYKSFEKEFAKFQIKYFLKNHEDESLLFINRKTGELLDIDLSNIDKNISKLKYFNSMSMKGKTNNVFQFSI